MKPDKITQAIHDARDEDAEAIIKVCEKKKHKLRNNKMNTGKEAFEKRNPSVCKKCEFHERKGHQHYCMFWDNKLIKIKWCNK
jgi:hypothetical protein